MQIIAIRKLIKAIEAKFKSYTKTCLYRVDGPNNLVKDFKLNIMAKYCQPDMPKLNFDKYLEDVLFNYINNEVKPQQLLEQSS